MLVNLETVAFGEFFDSNGVQIHYATHGEGEAVVLLHGWMSDSGMWGDLKTNRATAEFQLIAIDLRGHGNSDKSHETSMYDAEVAWDVVRLLDHLGIEKAHLVGYSSGAYVAGKVAAGYPDRIRSIVFGGQAPLIVAPLTGEADRSDLAETEIFAKLVNEGRDLGDYIRAVYPTATKMTDEQASMLAKLKFSGKDVASFAAAGRGFRYLAAESDELKRCTAPILFLYGENESEHVKKRVEIAQALFGRGELTVIEEADHASALTKPEFGSAILNFLRQARSK